MFHVVSVGTTTGYATRDYSQWPQFAPLLMLLLGCFATCGGSTGGGIKMMRMLLLLKQAQHELVRIVHPNVVNPVVIGGQVIPTRTMQNIIVGALMPFLPALPFTNGVRDYIGGDLLSGNSRIAEAVLFFADSTRSGFVTGQSLLVDGGISIALR